MERNKLLERMIKDKNLSYWSAKDLQDYIKKPVNVDRNGYTLDKNFEYSLEEIDAIDNCVGMEKALPMD